MLKGCHILAKVVQIENETGYGADLEAVVLNPLAIEFQSIYENYNNYSVDLVFFEEDLTDPLTPILIELPVNLVSYQCTVDGGSAAKIGSNRIRINIKAVNVFIDAYYKFIMPDYSTKILPANTSENVLSLVEWSTPQIKIKNILHTVAISTTDVFTFPQEVYWRYLSALEAFQNIIKNNKI